MSKQNNNLVPAYMNGETGMVTMDKLYEAAWIVQHGLSGTAFVLEALHDNIIFKLTPISKI